MAKLTRFYKLILILPLMMVAACSTNPATGEKQFTAFMPESSEAKIGAEEHEKIIKEFGGVSKNKKLQDYITSIGEKMVPHTERKDVKYTFTLLDSPIMNAFALPGGYVYITRGILAHANDEAELAAVIGHEIGHVTGKHSADRYSRSIIAAIGGTALGIAIGGGAGDLFSLGSNLYLKSHSREQESESDALGIRYMSKAGYDVNGASRFLATMGQYKKFDDKKLGDRAKQTPSYLLTHPLSEKRVADAKRNIAENYGAFIGKETNKVKYMQMISGMNYEDSKTQGFMKNGHFVHPDLGFTFPVPKGYYTQNQADRFMALSRKKDGATLLLTSDKKSKTQSLGMYVSQKMDDESLTSLFPPIAEKHHGLQVIQTKFNAKIKKHTFSVDTYRTYIEWDDETVFILTATIPAFTSFEETQSLLASLENFKPLSRNDKNRYNPKTIKVRAVKAGDTIRKLAAKLPFDDGFNVDRFRLINGLSPIDKLRVGQLYKTIVN